MIPYYQEADSIRSLATCSMLYDVFNKVTIDSQIASFSVSERALLKLHLSHVKQGDLLLLDRGYPSFWLLFLLQAQGIDYCVRLNEDGMHQVKEFIGSDSKEQTVRFTLPRKDRGELAGYPDYQARGKEISCRLISVALGNGRQEILCTSLLDTEKSFMPIR
ncbi:hypothetical protein FACS189440_13670 [Bacteroidia bacterium]|nr:hypothetical protein FACS189440_13670 [Bacteroidia bacterium]